MGMTCSTLQSHCACYSHFVSTESPKLSSSNQGWQDSEHFSCGFSLQKNLNRLHTRVLNHTRQFEEGGTVSFVDERVLNIVDHMVSSSCLVTSSMVTNASYIRVSKMIIKKKRVLPLLVSLFIDALVAIILYITYLYDPVPYISTTEGILLRNQAVDDPWKLITIPVPSTQVRSTAIQGTSLIYFTPGS